MTTTNSPGAVHHAASGDATETLGLMAGEADGRESLPAAIADRLVTPRPDCMIWTGATDRGYGRISIDGVVLRVHRVAWEAINGPIPDGLTIDHLCRVRSCCNAQHMELVTHGENVQRAVPHRPRPAKRTHCSKGHALTPDNVYVSPSDPYRHCRICRKADRTRSA